MRVVGAVLSTLVLVAGCGGEPATDEPTSTETTSSSSTRTTTSKSTTTTVERTPETETAATGAPDSSTAVPVVTVAPMVTAAPSLQLYYNPAGGMLYHVNGECPSIAKEYLPLTGFLFSQVNDAEFSKLDPCSTCHAPSRQ